MNNTIQGEREREARAYHEFISLAQAVTTRHTLNLIIFMDGEDSIKRWRFIQDVKEYYNIMYKNNHREFTGSEIEISYDNRSITVTSPDKGHCINMGYALRDFAKTKGFTIVW